jgi:hypothetical protein
LESGKNLQNPIRKDDFMTDEQAHGDVVGMGQVGSHIAELQHLLDQKDARIAELEESLNRIIELNGYDTAPEMVRIALSVIDNDGSSILKRLEAAEKVVEASRHQNYWIAQGMGTALQEAIEAYDALAEKKD